VALIIGMLFILIYLNSTNRVRDILYRYKISKEYILFEDRASGRLDIWKVGLNAFLMNPILGYGLENYPIIFDEIYPNILTIRKLKYGRGSHNIFLQLGVELGLIGVFIFLVFLLYHIKNLVNIVKATSNDYLNNNISLFLFLSIIGLLIGGLSLDVLYRKYFWIFYSLSESIINQYKRKLKLNRLNK
jgi:O-antigen ligase